MPPKNRELGHIIVKDIEFEDFSSGTTLLEALGRGFVIDGQGIEQIIFEEKSSKQPASQKLAVIYLLWGKEESHLIVQRPQDDYSIIARYTREMPDTFL
jgi:hypothetical protein